MNKMIKKYWLELVAMMLLAFAICFLAAMIETGHSQKARQATTKVVLKAENKYDCGSPERAVCQEGSEYACGCLGHGLIGTQKCNAHCSGFDACECPDTSAEDTAISEGAAACSKSGMDGKVTIVITTADKPPTSGEVVSVFGRVNGGDYSLWNQVYLANPAYLVITRPESASSLHFAFNLGWALPNNKDFGSWDSICPSTGCSAGTVVHTCKGKAWLGTVRGNDVSFDPLIGLCSVESGPWGMTEISCRSEK
ncbi:MAG: hypothetical protein WC766_02330 [Patescibacteria group bacterium]|jgi:hypothetical protein